MNRPLLGMVQENVAAQAVIKAFSLQRRTLGWFTMRNDDARRKNCSGGIPVDHGRAHGHDLRVGCCTSWCWRSAPISPPRAKSPSGFRDVRKCVLGSFLQHRPFDAFIPVSIQSAAAVRHIQELLDGADPRRRPPGAPTARITQ